MLAETGGKKAARPPDERVRVSDYKLHPYGLGKIEYSLFNSTGQAIRNARMVIVYYALGCKGDPVHYKLANVPTLVPPGLAVRSQTMDSAIEGNGSWCAKFRVLDYEVVEGRGAEDVPDFR